MFVGITASSRGHSRAASYGTRLQGAAESMNFGDRMSPRRGADQSLTSFLRNFGMRPAPKSKNRAHCGSIEMRNCCLYTLRTSRSNSACCSASIDFVDIRCIRPRRRPRFPSTRCRG